MLFEERPFYTQLKVIAAAVVLLHVGGLYALQSGLLRRTVNIHTPVVMLSALIQAPQPVMEPPPVQPKPAPTTPHKAAYKAPTLASVAQPLTTQDTAPSPARPKDITTPAPMATSADAAPSPPASPTSPVAPATAAPGAPASTKVELPNSAADYLNNPPPAYPAVSRRLGEEGKVLVRVLISADGIAQKGEIRGSSGFERLDAAALAAALRWRYMPGKRGGVAEAMWVNVPVAFTLN